MKILFITSARLGDAVLTGGLLNYLLQTYPTARFTIACGPIAAPYFEHMPNKAQTFILASAAPGSKRYWFDLWKHALKTRWDIVVDLRNSPVSYGLLSKKTYRLHGGRHEGPKVLRLAKVLNLPEPPAPAVWTTQEDHDLAAKYLAPGQAFVVLAPAAASADKVWPAEYFIQLWQKLSGTLFPQALPVIIAGPGESDRLAAAPLLQAFPEAVNLVNKVPLTVIAALLQRTDLFIGNDSGLMHLAAAASAPTIGIFGPTSALQYGPYGRKTTFAASKRPYTEALISDVSPEEVFEKITCLMQS